MNQRSFSTRFDNCYRFVKKRCCLSVTELQVYGYFNEALQDATELNSQSIISELQCLLSQEAHCPQKQFLLRHHNFWNHPDNINSIDELVQSLHNDSWPEQWESMKPRQLLNTLREQQRMKSYGHDEEYNHLQSLPDSEETGLVVLRTKYQILDAGRRLHNCAANQMSR